MRQLTEHCWVLEAPTNIGFILQGQSVTLIDSGKDKEAGRKINKILKEKNWELEGIILTHSNADHMGGTDYLQRMYDCRVYATQAEKAFIESPEIEAAFLWGGFPPKELNQKFFRAKPSRVTHVIDSESTLENHLQVIPLGGHFFDMIGILTEEGVCFLGDALFGEKILDKYQIPFLYDVRAFRETLEAVKTIQAEYFVISHGEILTDIIETANTNLQVVKKLEEIILSFLGKKQTFDKLLKQLCDSYQITLNTGQYALIGNTLRSFLSYLYHEERITCRIEENQLYWSSH